MSSWRKILWPLVPLYAVITGSRNLLFDLGILSQKKFRTPVLAVGNLSTGGSGKTPMVELLLRKLDHHKCGFVSRGYGRKTRGPRLIKASDKVEDIGDEPWQIMQKFPGLKAAVAEKRARGIEMLLGTSDPPELIILDDAFQHRHVKPKVNLLLTTWQKPFFRDYLLPAGDLRESRAGHHRADILVVTKFPANLEEKDRRDFLLQMGIRDRPVFFSGIEYSEPVNARGEKLPRGTGEVNLLTGIADAQSIKERLIREYRLQHHWQYGDHHHFVQKEIEALEAATLPILTTEKDWARLRDRISKDLAGRLYRWPIQTVIRFGQEAEFIELITQKLDLNQ